MGPRHLDLYRRYHRFMAEQRGWSEDTISGADYYDSFLSGGADYASQWLYFAGEELVGVSLMDERKSLEPHFHLNMP